MEGSGGRVGAMEGNGRCVGAMEGSGGRVEAMEGSGGRVRKGKNFCEAEEKQLCYSFLHVSQDPKLGTGQKSGNFWNRIMEHYNENKPEGGGFRPARSLETKWSVIKHDVAKFIGVYTSVYNLRESGTSLEDVLLHALELYRLKSPKGIGFVYIHAWKILKDVPRWGETREEARRQDIQAKKRSTPNLQSMASEGGSEAEFVEGDDCVVVEGEQYRAFKRPSGNQAAKDEQRKEKMKESAMHRHAKATEEMAMASKLKSQILADQAALALFSMPESSCPLAREFILLRKQEEIARIWRRSLEAEPLPQHPSDPNESSLNQQNIPRTISCSPTPSPSHGGTPSTNILSSNSRMPIVDRNRLHFGSDGIETSTIHLTSTTNRLQFIESQNPQIQPQDNCFSPLDGEFHSYDGYSQGYGSPNSNHMCSSSQHNSFSLDSANIVPETEGDCGSFNLNV